PHNIMLSCSGDAKVTDFGIAKAQARMTRTSTGMIKGKVAYMAPEQAQDKPLDKRSDQFSLGLVLWECLTGERAYRGESELAVLRRVTRCDLVSPRTLRSDIPEALEQIVMRALRSDPQARFNDLSEMEHALSTWRFSMGPAGAVSLAGLVAELEEKPQVLSEGGHAVDRGTLVLPNAGADEPAPHPPSDWSLPSESVTTLAEECSVEPSMISVIPKERIPREASTSTWNRLWRRPWSMAALVSVVVVILSSLFWGGDGAFGRFDDHTRSPDNPSEQLGDVPTTTAQSRQDNESQVAVKGSRDDSTLIVQSIPSGADIFVDDVAVGLKTPASLPGLVRHSPVRLSLLHEGFAKTTRTLTPSSVQQSVEIVLDTIKQPEPATKPTETVAKPAAAKRKKKNKRHGSLSLRSSGIWAHVYLGSRKLGTTPLDGVSVPEGEQTLRLVNPIAKVDKQIKIKVIAGQHLQTSIALE
ncbi:MAG: serine/threonine-protein kinase, partial [Myxococcota bacterium]